MRINEKHLASFATANSSVEREGYLRKRGELNTSMQRRWFVLKGNLLFYFERKGDKEPIGVIILEGCTVELAEDPDASTFELVFPGAGSRKYVLSADSQEDLEQWMRAIASAGYDYMKVMVCELQRQLEDLNSRRKSVEKPVMRQKEERTSELLVDLTEPETRGNPFNMDQAQAEKMLSDSTFDRLHQQYGSHIRLKMHEALTS